MTLYHDDPVRLETSAKKMRRISTISTRSISIRDAIAWSLLCVFLVSLVAVDARFQAAPAPAEAWTPLVRGLPRLPENDHRLVSLTTRQRDRPQSVDELR